MKDVAVYNEIEIRFDDQLMNLTNMWRAAGSDPSKHPRYWLRLPSTIKFVETLAKKLNVRLSHILKTTRGRYGGTYGHWQIAMNYSQYLSAEFHIWCNEVVKDRFEHHRTSWCTFTPHPVHLTEYLEPGKANQSDFLLNLDMQMLSGRFPMRGFALSRSTFIDAFCVTHKYAGPMVR